MSTRCVIYKFYILKHKIMIYIIKINIKFILNYILETFANRIFDEVEFLISYGLENRLLFLVNYW